MRNEMVVEYTESYFSEKAITKGGEFHPVMSRDRVSVLSEFYIPATNS